MTILKEIVEKFQKRFSEQQDPIKLDIPGVIFSEYQSFEFVDPKTSKKSKIYVSFDTNVKDSEKRGILDFIKVIFLFCQNSELLEENLYQLYGVNVRIIENSIFVGYFD